MKKPDRKRIRFEKLAVVVFLLLASFVMIAPGAAAQGCAMCYQNAAAAGSNAQAGLRQGILILLIPALGLFAGILGILYQRSDE